MVAGSVLHSVKTNEGSGEIHLSGLRDARRRGGRHDHRRADRRGHRGRARRRVHGHPNRRFVRIRRDRRPGRTRRASCKDDEELEPLVGVALVQVYDADRVLLSVAPVGPERRVDGRSGSCGRGDPRGRCRLRPLARRRAGRRRDLDRVPAGLEGRDRRIRTGRRSTTAEATITSSSTATRRASWIPSRHSRTSPAPSPGPGSMTVDLANSLGSDTALDLTVDMTGTSQGFTFAMTLDSTPTNEVTAGVSPRAFRARCRRRPGRSSGCGS